MEDREGLKLYKDSHEAWNDFANATLMHYGPDKMPNNWEEASQLAHKMIDYYSIWLIGRQHYKTFIHNGIPQVEVRFEVPIPVNDNILALAKVDAAIYRGTIDRVCVDEYGRLWIVEYKTAKVIQRTHYLTDPQVTAYVWAAQMLYNQPIEGCLYMQWRKDVPNEPLVLRNGRLSTNKQQKTTHRFYREALIKVYGKVAKAPKANVDFLNHLTTTETEFNDGFVCSEKIHRNQQCLDSEGIKILMETEDMLNPDLPLYPNPTRDCFRMCSFRDPCVDLDNGDDWEETLNLDFERKTEARGADPWRKLLKHQLKPVALVA